MLEKLKSLKSYPMKKVYILFCILLGFSVMLFSQSSCPNLDFSYGNFTNWKCYEGGLPTSSPTRIKIMHSASTNGRTTEWLPSNLLILPNGYNYTCRLGVWEYRNITNNLIYDYNMSGVGNSAAVEYELLVDSNNTLLVVYFPMYLHMEL